MNQDGGEIGINDNKNNNNGNEDDEKMKIEKQRKVYGGNHR